MALTTIPVPVVASLSYNREVFLTSGTFTLPATAFNKFDAVLVSGGGGGSRGNAASGTFGGSGLVAFFQDIYCTNGTTLTITVGAGGAGSTTLGANGSNGTASTITGMAGNGASTSISSGAASGGAVRASAPRFQVSPQVAFSFGNVQNRQTRMRDRGAGFGMGMTSFQSGSFASGYTTNTYIFGSQSTQNLYTCNNTTGYISQGGTGGPVPLLGSLLHANVGTSGTAGTNAGGASTANTFFAGTGGGGNYVYAGTTGKGGGGGGGGGSNSGGTTSGSGGNASANSGGGGGASGINNVTPSNTGNGGSGGSGFIVIGYWG